MLPSRLFQRTLRAFPRYNSTSTSTSTSTSATARTSRIAEMASRAERPTALETAVPVMWLATGVLGYVALNRVGERDAGVVDEVCV